MPTVGLQIKAARSLKRLLTGRLSSPVSSYPVFPGNEANYLRAQVCAAMCERPVGGLSLRTGCPASSLTCCMRRGRTLWVLLAWGQPFGCF